MTIHLPMQGQEWINVFTALRRNITAAAPGRQICNGHGTLLSFDERPRAQRRPRRGLAVKLQPAGSWLGPLFVLEFLMPLPASIAIWRGFVAAGTSRTRSILSMPFSNEAAFHLHISRQVECPSERSGRDALKDILVLTFLDLAAFDRQHVRLGAKGDLAGREAGQSQ
jgi:hypothetical protein